jgi:hypothetical protein
MPPDRDDIYRERQRVQDKIKRKGGEILKKKGKKGKKHASGLGLVWFLFQPRAVVSKQPAASVFPFLSCSPLFRRLEGEGSG